jgi:hypothetical protein
MPKVSLFFVLILISALFFIGQASALQQTIGSLSINVSIGNSSYTKYGVLNDANDTITVKLNVIGDVSKYLEYPKELTLVPKELTDINVKINIPKDYSGKEQLNGTIFVFTEETGKVNVKLGKQIILNVLGVDKQSNNVDYSNINFINSIILVFLILVFIGIVIKNKKNKSKEVEKK